MVPSKSPSRRPLRVGIDTGGTFTDVAVIDRGRLTIHKLPSTPDDPSRAVVDGLAAVRGDREVDVVHGTTVGLNAVLTRRLSRTAFVTNEGFADLVEIGRQDRTGLYDLEPRRAEFPVPRDLRFCVATRRRADGALERSVSRTALIELAKRLRAARVEAIAIGLLHSHTHLDDERTIAAALSKLGVPITCSAELLPRPGEFERFSAAVLNAAIQPIVGAYLARLVTAVAPGRLRLLRSSGGILGEDEAIAFPARAMFSGPAGGVIATARIANLRGEARVAALDMGGTSTDVALVGREQSPSDDDRRIADLPLPLPSYDVHTVGCGGGSLAWVDSGGALRVGPISAGADPGPACYGNSLEPTVTDAHVALGHIACDTLLGGGLPIDPDRSVRAIERLARRLGLRAKDTAHGVLAVADAAMARALLVITSERAVDPARVPLVAYGGAGGLHAAALAGRLSMPYALVPHAPGALSAIGLALAGESREVIEPVLAAYSPRLGRELVARGKELCAGLRAALGGRARVALEVRLRFQGQGGGLWVGSGSDLEAGFRDAHRTRFGFDAVGGDLEVVELRARADQPGPALTSFAGTPDGGSTGHLPRRTAPLGRTVLVEWRRDQLGLGMRVRGPSLIREETSVTRVPPDWLALVTSSGLELRPGHA
ncbi:MAG: hydantoinase/oxoprolinase family protein [Planctomycetes bacterium]|nr:hydantoinase/oxoprolinase family protein [Planctomycetota bacterium]